MIPREAICEGGPLAVISGPCVVECDSISVNNALTAKWYMNDLGPMRRADAAVSPRRDLVPAGRSRGGTRSGPGVAVNGPEHSGIRARSSFALPRLLACYIARDRGRSAKPARSLLTELFRPPGPGRTKLTTTDESPIIAANTPYRGIPQADRGPREDREEGEDKEKGEDKGG